jgi:hypothetical protein
MMLKLITILLLCQLAGEVLSEAANVPIPGPVIGMVFLFAGIAIRDGVPCGLGDGAAAAAALPPGVLISNVPGKVASQACRSGSPVRSAGRGC